MNRNCMYVLIGLILSNCAGCDNPQRNKQSNSSPNQIDHYKLGVTHFENKQYTKALEEFNQVIRINPNSVSGHISRGIVYSKLGNQDKALQDLTKAIHLDPNNIGAYTNRALYYNEIKNHRSALQDLNKAIQIKPQGAALYGNRGLTWLMMNDHDNAQKDFNKCYMLDRKLKPSIEKYIKEIKREKRKAK